MIDIMDYMRTFRFDSNRRVIYEGTYETLSMDIKEGQEIDSIIFDSEEEVDKRVIKVGKHVFKCNKIVVGQHSYTNQRIQLFLYYTTLNKVANYLLPVIFNVPESNVGKKALLYDSNFVNAYVSIDDSPLDYSIYLLYRFDGSINMGNLEDWIQKSDLYIKTIQPDKYHTIYQLKVKERETYDTFISSRFADFSQKHKQRIVNFYQLKSTDSKYQIIYNSKELRVKKEEELATTIPEHVSLNEAIDIKNETYYTEDMKVVYTLSEEGE